MREGAGRCINCSDMPSPMLYACINLPLSSLWSIHLHLFGSHPSSGSPFICPVLIHLPTALPPQGVRTADDASLTVKVMVFYSLTNLELMLNSTHDPIGDFINALLADLMNFGSRFTYEQFIQNASKLSDLETFPVLCSRAEAVGFSIGKVVYRGEQDYMFQQSCLISVLLVTP